MIKIKRILKEEMTPATTGATPAPAGTTPAPAAAAPAMQSGDIKAGLPSFMMLSNSKAALEAIAKDIGNEKIAPAMKEKALLLLLKRVGIQKQTLANIVSKM